MGGRAMASARGGVYWRASAAAGGIRDATKTMGNSEKETAGAASHAAGEIAGRAMGVSLAIMVSRVLGLLRDVVLVFYFSAAAWIAIVSAAMFALDGSKRFILPA